MNGGRGRACPIAASVLWVVVAGCVAVNPEPDYRRSAEMIQRATGIADVYDTRGMAAVRERVDALLADEMTSDEAAEIVLLNNRELQAAFQDIGVARADLVQSGLLSNPTLAMAFRLPAGGGLTAIDLDIGQSIAELWQIPARRRSAEHSLEQTILRIAHQASALATRAKEAHCAARGAEQRLTIARENHDLTRETFELSEFRQQAGAGNTLDVNLARGALLEAQLAVERARLAASDAKRNLAALLGLTFDAENLALATESPSALRTMPRDELVLAALANRLDVRALREAVGAADERFALERARVLPSLEIGLSLEREARGPIPDRDVLADTARASIDAGRLTAPEIEPRSARDAEQNVTLGPGFSLELPIFDQNQAQIARARCVLEQALHRLDALKTAITQEVSGVADQLETTQRIVQLYKEDVLPQSRQNLDMARESYRAGKTGFLSVLEAERTYLTTRERFASARQQAAEALARLERTVGVPLAAIATLNQAVDSGHQNQRDAELHRDTIKPPMHRNSTISAKAPR